LPPRHLQLGYINSLIPTLPVGHILTGSCRFIPLHSICSACDHCSESDKCCCPYFYRTYMWKHERCM